MFSDSERLLELLQKAKDLQVCDLLHQINSCFKHELIALSNRVQTATDNICSANCKVLFNSHTILSDYFLQNVND